MQYLIDIVGTCNLRCPSCPVGNFKAADFTDVARPKGFMEFELFQKVLDKIERESGGEPFEVFLYNWGEALIHPRIGNLVGELARRGIRFHISTNLNTHADLVPIVRARPASVRISLSGFGKESYSKGHVGGDPNLVISNMYRLRWAMDHCKIEVPTHAYYHVYRDNCGDDILRMADLCNRLGFGFAPGWAYFMGMEKVLAYLEGKPRFTPSDWEVLGRTVHTLDEGIALAQSAQSPTCYLKTAQTVINHDGSVALCCGVYDPVHFVAKDFLAISREQLREVREAHTLCTKCMGAGLHDYGMYNPHEAWDEAGVRRQMELGQSIGTRMFPPAIFELKVAKPGKAATLLGRALDAWKK